MYNVIRKTVEYVCNNNLLHEYRDNEYVIAEFRVDDGFVSKNICDTNVYYKKEKDLIIGKSISGINPKWLGSHTDYNNYIICKPIEVNKLFDEWKNLPAIRELRKNDLKNIINKLSKRIHKLKSELSKIE